MPDLLVKEKTLNSGFMDTTNIGLKKKRLGKMRVNNKKDVIYPS